VYLSRTKNLHPILVFLKFSARNSGMRQDTKHARSCWRCLTFVSNMSKTACFWDHGVWRLETSAFFSWSCYGENQTLTVNLMRICTNLMIYNSWENVGVKLNTTVMIKLEMLALPATFFLINNAICESSFNASERWYFRQIQGGNSVLLGCETKPFISYC
jgi:hypothetical protein